MKKQTENWNSKIGVILAVAGSAVGLGNFLRFPGQVAEFGGGAFMLAYFISFILIGLPMCWTEWTMGRLGGKIGFNSCPSIFGVITSRPWAKFVGIIGVVIPIIIYMYYVIVEAWCLAYAANYALGNMDFKTASGVSSDAVGDFFVSMVGLGADGSALMFDIRHVGFFVIGVFLLNFYLIYRGISRGIEWFCRLAMPTLIILALVILARVLTLGTPDAAKPEHNISNGLGFMWNPNKILLQERDAESGKWATKEQLFTDERIADFRAEARSNPDMRIHELTVADQLGKPKLWLAAAGQIFFSLSVGFGVIITYSSYLNHKDDVVLSGLAASGANEFCEVGIGGLLTIPAGVAFLGTAGMMGAIGSTFGMGFNVLPMVFASMPGGAFFGFLFFVLLFLAAVTSSLSMLQPGIAFLEESLGINRKQSVTLLGVITALGAGFILYFSASLKALDTMDFWVTNLLMVLLATIQIILFAWVIGMEKGMKEAHTGASMKIPTFFRFVIKYVSPTLLLAILGTWFYTDILGFSLTGAEQSYSQYIKDLFIEPDTVAWLSIAIIALVGFFCALIVGSSKKLKTVMDNQDYDI